MAADAAREEGLAVVLAEAVELRGTPGTVALPAGQFFQHVGLDHPAPEGTFIQRLLQDDLVDPLQFRQMSW